MLRYVHSQVAKRRHSPVILCFVGVPRISSLLRGPCWAHLGYDQPLDDWACQRERRHACYRELCAVLQVAAGQGAASRQVLQACAHQRTTQTKQPLLTEDRYKVLPLEHHRHM